MKIKKVQSVCLILACVAATGLIGLSLIHISNGKKQVYDWNRYYECVRKYQPDACICVCGPDIRWCGNEAGDVRKSEWSVVPARTALAESVQERSQQTDDEEFRMRRITSDMEDLGSRKALEGETDLIWYPAEVNTSIRPGWFYHPEEDDQVKSLEERCV